MRLRLAGLALLAALAGCLPELPQPELFLVKEPPPAPSNIRRIPLSFAVEMIGQRAAKSVTLEAFNTGTLRARGEGVSSLKSYQSKLDLPVPAFLIRHSSRGLVLFGTGLSPERERRPDNELLSAALFLASSDYSFRYKQRRKQDLVRSLVRAGVDPEEVGTVIVPYWGPETAGMVDAFPKARVLVNRREWEWRSGLERGGREPGPLDPARFGDKLALELVDLHNAPAFGAFENGLDLFGDKSLFLVGLPGRTPGNMGLWANLDQGPVLLAGGAAFVVDNYLDRALPIKQKMHDLEEYWLSLHLIRAMLDAVPRLLVVPGNDLSPLRILKRPDVALRE